ncbi:hypothetical protein cypCar_00007979 [Cyprinus carpio]|nr:hypothetical protein cypCar_00007979 [Cyprinus carpio]
MLSEWFWWDRLWLPRPVTWADLQDSEGRVYARVSHLYIILPVAVLLLGLRAFYERLIAVPLAEALGVKDKIHKRASHNPVLEKYYKTHSKHPTQANIKGVCKKLGWSERQVERWFRRRRNQDRPGVLKKFKEARNHGFMIYGKCGQDFPNKLSFFCLSKSAKMFNYAGWETTCNSIFVVFALVFMVTRLIIFPFWLIHCTWVYPLDQFEPFFGYYFFNVMLVVLLLLHVFWASLILRMVKKFIFGKLKGDERSDEEEDEEGSEEDYTHTYSNGSGNGLSNGH